ncbi:hypothetical protein BGZ94_000581 [Podila epigama]|nr:hypothetical protein BGZ94_000581 [Podila epigama]
MPSVVTKPESTDPEEKGGETAVAEAARVSCNNIKLPSVAPGRLLNVKQTVAEDRMAPMTFPAGTPYQLQMG